jgi:hypothetical protein
MKLNYVKLIVASSVIVILFAVGNLVYDFLSPSFAAEILTENLSITPSDITAIENALSKLSASDQQIALKTIADLPDDAIQLLVGGVQTDLAVPAITKMQAEQATFEKWSTDKVADLEKTVTGNDSVPTSPNTITTTTQNFFTKLKNIFLAIANWFKQIFTKSASAGNDYRLSPGEHQTVRNAGCGSCTAASAYASLKQPFEKALQKISGDLSTKRTQYKNIVDEKIGKLKKDYVDAHATDCDKISDSYGKLGCQEKKNTTAKALRNYEQCLSAPVAQQMPLSGCDQERTIRGQIDSLVNQSSDIRNDLTRLSVLESAQKRICQQLPKGTFIVTKVTESGQVYGNFGAFGCIKIPAPTPNDNKPEPPSSDGNSNDGSSSGGASGTSGDGGWTTPGTAPAGEYNASCDYCVPICTSKKNINEFEWSGRRAMCFMCMFGCKNRYRDAYNNMWNTGGSSDNATPILRSITPNASSFSF